MGSYEFPSLNSAINGNKANMNAYKFLSFNKMC